MESNFTIGIIGGYGKMGTFFKNFFEKKGYPVVLSGRNKGLEKIELVKQSKVILISVPIKVFPEIVKEISSYIEDHHWVIDICSLKAEPVKVMKDFIKKGEVLATHPLFGPYEKDLKGKIIAIWRIKGDNLYRWFKSIMEEENLNIIEISPEKHDQIMGLVQVLNHFWLILLAKIINDSGLDLKDIVSLTTTSFFKQLDVLRRLSYQDARLYARIQLDNPYGKKFRDLLCKNCLEFNKALDLPEEEREKKFEEYFTLAKNIASELEKLIQTY